MMNYKKYSDEELLELRKKTYDRYVSIKGQGGNDVMMFFLYGIFAFVGVLVWALGEATSGYPLWAKVLNYVIVASGAAAIMYARKLENTRKFERDHWHEEMVKIDSEYISRRK
ncbi:hypothetical protein GC087_25695 (plasmid) [Pantoea sp. JZ2]|uniref:hypothetical protein n=1 Tax=Pantoea sp. JZ2 TaxID=2654189 RepID=UPI002B4830FC|nr:hypothetical protein [Pantoea sp. JZ2]WRH12437.1 hypothetical protein GC087_07285 [Pantoea sp. JZ2]WRH15963.1 hypothetical protein GC087_25695 [Pantoea sp. JZ2]